MFNQAQQKWIDLGVLNRLDVSVYEEETYNADQMEELYNGLLSGVDVFIYAYPIYTWQQMNILRRGLESGVDVKSILDPGLNHRSMEEELTKLLSELPPKEESEMISTDSETEQEMLTYTTQEEEIEELVSEVVEENEEEVISESENTDIIEQEDIGVGHGESGPSEVENLNPTRLEDVTCWSEMDTRPSEKEDWPKIEEMMRWPMNIIGEVTTPEIAERMIEFTNKGVEPIVGVILTQSDALLNECIEDAEYQHEEIIVKEDANITISSEDEELLKLWQSEYDARDSEVAATNVEHKETVAPDVFFKELALRIRNSAHLVDFEAYFNSLKEKVDTQTDYVLNREFQEEVVRRYFDTLYLSVEDAFLKFLEDMDERNK